MIIRCEVDGHKANDTVEAITQDLAVTAVSPPAEMREAGACLCLFVLLHAMEPHRLHRTILLFSLIGSLGSSIQYIHNPHAPLATQASFMELKCLSRDSEVNYNDMCIQMLLGGTATLCIGRREQRQKNGPQVITSLSEMAMKDLLPCTKVRALRYACHSLGVCCSARKQNGIGSSAWSKESFSVCAR